MTLFIANYRLYQNLLLQKCFFSTVFVLISTYKFSNDFHFSWIKNINEIAKLDIK